MASWYLKISHTKFKNQNIMLLSFYKKGEKDSKKNREEY